MKEGEIEVAGDCSFHKMRKNSFAKRSFALILSNLTSDNVIVFLWMCGSHQVNTTIYYERGKSCKVSAACFSLFNFRIFFLKLQIFDACSMKISHDNNLFKKWNLDICAF